MSSPQYQLLIIELTIVVDVPARRSTPTMLFEHGLKSINVKFPESFFNCSSGDTAQSHSKSLSID